MAVNVNDMFYAYSGNEAIKEKGEYGGVVTTIMKYLLEEGIVDAVVAVEEAADLYDAKPILITDPEDVIKSAGSLHCGTLNLAKFVSKYLDGARDMKIAVTTKPCDAMTLKELMRKRKVIEENVIMIGVNCGGTMPPVPTMKMIRDVYELDPADVIKEEISKGKLIMETADGEKAISIDELEEDGMGRRENCQRCTMNIPTNADLALGNWGVIGDLAGKATFVEVCSEKGADILGKVIDAGLIETQAPIEKGVTIRSNIDNIMVKQAMAQREKDFAGPEWVPGGYTPAAPFFHLTRMVHMVDACTNCGQCSEVCPCEIPVSKVWATVNQKVRDIFGYYSGVDNEEPLPFTEFGPKSYRQY